MSSNGRAYFAIIIANKTIIQGYGMSSNRKAYFAINSINKPIIQGCPVTGKLTLLSLFSRNLLFKDVQ